MARNSIDEPSEDVVASAKTERANRRGPFAGIALFLRQVMVELKKVSSYQQGSFIEKGGWATLPGSDTANSSVARACAEMLSSLK